MTGASLRRILLATGSVLALACLPAAAEVAEVGTIEKFKGTITDMGVLRGFNQIGGIEYRIEGKFTCRPGVAGDPCQHLSAPINLTNSTLTFLAFFDEVDGWGEMVLTVGEDCPNPPPGSDVECVVIGGPEFDNPIRNAHLLPLSLGSAGSSKATEAKYETPGRFRPQIRSQIKHKSGEFQFNIRLDRGLSPQVAEDDPRRFPNGCPNPQIGVPGNPPDEDGRIRTTVRTSFSITDHVNDNVVVVNFLTGWECPQPERYHLRAR
jgi:hypothetical protein